MSNFTFLTEEQYFGDDKLDVIEKRGTEAAITDFSILLGGYVSDSKVDNDSSLEGRTCWYWTKSDDGDNNARVVTSCSYRDYDDVDERFSGARPALPFSSIDKIPTNEVEGRRAADGILEIEYGYYPQKAAPKDIQERLEQAFKSGRLSRTGKSYTTDSRKYIDYDKEFLENSIKNINTMERDM